MHSDMLIEDGHSIAHGYNLADLDRLARVALTRARGYSGYVLDRYQAAWSGIAEALCLAEEPPAPGDLITAGWQAVNDHAHLNNLAWGLAGHEDRRPAFVRYWTPTDVTPIEDRITDAAALWQILPCLTDRQYQALVALAATEDYDLAAAAMGLSRSGYATTVKRAREAFLALWHEGEQPSKIWRRDQRRGRTSSTWRRITASELDTIRDRIAAGVPQRIIAAEYGVHTSTISGLLRGSIRPAPDTCA